MICFCSTVSPEFSVGPVLSSDFLPVTASFPLVSDFLEAAVAEVLEVPPVFGEAFSEDNSVLLFGFGPDLAAATEDCLEGAEEAFTGLGLDLAVAPFPEAGFVSFFLGASLAALSAPEVFTPSLLSSFLGEAGFFTEDPCLATWWSGVLLPLVSALAAVTPADTFSAAAVLAFSLTVDLLVGLLVFVVSDL